MLTSIRSRLAGWISPRAGPESRSIDYGASPFMAGNGLGNGTLAGPTINDRTALSIAAFWRGINIYANTIGALDFYIAERDERGARRPSFDHPAYDLLHTRPNKISTSMRLRQALIGHVFTNGNGYLEIEWDARGRYPVALHLMDPREITPTWNSDKTSIVYRQNFGPDLPPEDVIHIAMFGWDGLRGYSPVTTHRDNLSIPAAQRTYQAALFGNGLGMRGHIEIPGTATTKQKAEIRDNMNRVHQGPANAGNFGILDNGGKWVQTQFSPQDAEVILGCRFSVEEVARILNLPPHLLGVMEGTNFATIEEQNIQFYQMSIYPVVKAIEQEFNNKLFGPIERTRYSVYHDVSTLLRGNTQAQRAQEKEDLATGVRSINEIRIERGLNPIPDAYADKHWVPTNNLQALEDMGKTKPEPAVELDPDTATEEDPLAVRSALEIEPAEVAARGVLKDVLGRMVRRECKALRRAAKRHDFHEWLDTFYPGHSEFVAEATGMACHMAGAVIGREVDPKSLADGMAADSRDRLRGLVSMFPPDELPVQVDRACSEWEAGRADSLIDLIMSGGNP